MLKQELIRNLIKIIKAEVEGKEFSFVSSADIKWIKEAERKEITKDVEHLNRADIPKGDSGRRLYIKTKILLKKRAERRILPHLLFLYHIQKMQQNTILMVKEYQSAAFQYGKATQRI